MASMDFNFTRIASEDLIWDDASGAYVKYVPPAEKPEQLYAYTKEGIAMYAWTIEDGSEVTPSSCNTIYTTTPVLDLNNGVFYDENGVKYTTSPKVTSDLTLKHSDSSADFFSTYAIEATDEKITMGATTLD